MFIKLACLVLFAFAQCLDVNGETNEPPGKEDYLNRCLRMNPWSANYTKTVPSPEPGLKNSRCSTFADLSCCKAGVDDHWKHVINSYAHCPQTESLKQICEDTFYDELCFYLCSPDVGPWIVRDHYEERDAFVDLPICESTCEQWYSACQEEHTCSDNWYSGFNVSSGGMVCLNESKCYNFTDHFKTAKTFCDQVWNHAYKVVPDDQPCMQFKYDTTSGVNPNKAVAEDKAKQLATAEAKTEKPAPSDSPRCVSGSWMILQFAILSGLLIVFEAQKS